MGQNITYAPRSASKSQVLADFVAESTEIHTPLASIEHESWTMYFDSSVMKEGANVGLVFISPLRVRMEYMVQLYFPVSNNAAEYEALINGLRIAIKLGTKRLEIKGDSELVVDQVMKGTVSTRRWWCTVKPYEIWRASSTASSCITCCVTTTKQSTYSQRPHPFEARFLMGSSRVINTRHPYEQKARSHQRVRARGHGT
jgi:ribonuclease HI